MKGADDREGEGESGRPDILRAAACTGTSRILTFCPGRNGQCVVDGSPGLQYSKSSSSRYYFDIELASQDLGTKDPYIVPISTSHLQSAISFLLSCMNRFPIADDVFE